LGEYLVTGSNENIVLAAFIQKQRRQVDLLAERLAIPLASDDDDIGSLGHEAASQRQHGSQPHAAALQRITAGLIHHADDRDLAAACIHHIDIDLRTLDEASAAEFFCDQLFG